MTKYISIDVESDGPLLGTNSMVCFGAVLVDLEGKLETDFYGQVAPITGTYNKEALSISGFTRKEHENFPSPAITMQKFYDWLIDVKEEDKIVFISDNNGYDFSWINWYLLMYSKENPFGWSSRRIGDMFCGYKHNLKYQWKKHRDLKRFPHNHNPLSDCKANATAFLKLKDFGFKI